MDLLLHGLEVQRQLLKGTKAISLVGPIKEFSKPGGLIQALVDFNKISRTEVKKFPKPNGVNMFSKTTRDSIESSLYVMTVQGVPH